MRKMTLLEISCMPVTDVCFRSMEGVHEVDYLGQFEEIEEVETPSDVMRQLLRQGVKETEFVPRAELSISGGYIQLFDPNHQVIEQVQIGSRTSF